MSDKDKLLTSSYDGIQEYDNDLPQWWVWLFIITIVFGVGYSAYYYSGTGPTQSQYLEADLKHVAAMAPKESASTVGGVSEAELIALASDAGAVAKGKELYVQKCAACHVADGGGLIGPNLTDDYWIHGGKISDIHRVIMEGVLDKGMVAWKTMMPPEEINAVTAFVWTLHGTTPAKSKEPQGELAPRS